VDRYEYRVHQFKKDFAYDSVTGGAASIERVLNTWSVGGWEYVNVIMRSSDQFYVFRRPIPPPPATESGPVVTEQPVAAWPPPEPAVFEITLPPPPPGPVVVTLAELPPPPVPVAVTFAELPPPPASADQLWPTLEPGPAPPSQVIDTWPEPEFPPMPPFVPGGEPR